MYNFALSANAPAIPACLRTTPPLPPCPGPALRPPPQLFGTGYVRNWVGVMVVLLAVCMNEGAVDSLQNGIACSLGGHFFKNAPLWVNRCVVRRRGAAAGWGR